MIRPLILALLLLPAGSNAATGFRAGAASVDITPKNLPAIRNGGFLQARWNRIEDRLFARALVMQSGKETVALCVVDSCMLPTDVCDAIKADVARRVRIPPNRILISATHTHSAPSTMWMCLGTRKDEDYSRQMIPQVAQAIIEAHAKLRVASVGWAQVDAPEHTNCRRWIRRSDKIAIDPFGERSIRAMMHPGYQNPEFTGPAGPVDPQLSLLSFISVEDSQPICLLANYSMHYFGSGAGFSADYFGELARGLEEAIGGANTVALVSQGTSGDLHWMDYSQPKREGFSRKQYSEELTTVAVELWKNIEHRTDLDLAMAEAKLELERRTPSEARLAWAKSVNAARGNAVPGSKQEVYAEQAQWIHENPRTELILQALRIGQIAITAIPNEVYGITGLKLKAQSPLPTTFNIELANGAEGYIPPPEQHKLGGYTTWPARTAGLEEEAEPKIVDTLLGLLEVVSGKERRPALATRDTPYRQRALQDKPKVFWPLDELAGHTPSGLHEGRDAHSTSKASDGFGPVLLEDGIALGLPGVVREGGAISAAPKANPAISGDRVNRSVHFAGGRLRSPIPGLGRRYSVEFWFWNAFPADQRPVTGYLFSRGLDGDARALGEHLGIGGTAKDTTSGRLFFYTGNGIGQVVQGRSVLATRDWHHVVLVRNDDKLTVYLDGRIEIEADSLPWTLPATADEIFFGGRCDRFAGFEGKLDEISVYDSALTASQVAGHFEAANRVPPERHTTKPDSKPLPPTAALKALHLPEGFEAQIVASEPLVLDPVAFDWDTRGRLWVVEMADYPLGLGRDGASGGRVRVLEDQDGDGIYDNSSLFADSLNFPNGILAWRDGAIVSAAPNILFLRDADGDGQMDTREVLLTGLSEGNQQLRANGLRWGMDGWVYVAAGGHHGKYGTGTTLHSTRSGVSTVIGSRDFRFRPNTGRVEPESGPTQFGRNPDDWGHWFGTQNSHPLWHYVLPERYLRRNPHLAAPDGRVQLPGGSNPPVYPASKPEKRYHNFQQAGRYTSACGGMVYRDNLLTAGSETRAFVCEPFHNLVQQLRLTDHGVTFAAERVGGESEPDFFASEDRWCRPVMARTGPDGALWIADMYRYMIEHPQWLPSEGKAELLPHYRRGDNRGRIYRVTRKDAAPRTIPILADLAVEDLAEQMGSTNGWVRDRVQQELLWYSFEDEKRQAVVRALGELLESNLAQTRVQALWTLALLEEIRPEQVAHALSDTHPRVRENALLVAESLSPDRDVLAAIVSLTADSDPKVRLQLALSLGEWSHPEAGEALASLLESSSDHPFIANAVLTSALPHLNQLSDTSRSTDAILQLAIATQNEEAAGKLIDQRLASRNWPIIAALAEQLADAPPIFRDRLRPVFEEAASTIASDGIPQQTRIAAASVLAHDSSRREATVAFLVGCLTPTTPPASLASVIQTLKKVPSEPIATELLEAWPTLPPLGREQVTDALLSRPQWATRLLSSLEDGSLRLAALDPTRRTRLLNHPNPKIKQTAARLLNSTLSPSRSKVIEAHREALKMKGDVVRGRAAYRRACTSCHQLGTEGLPIGPDLRTVAAHSAEKILINILDPNLDIQPGYHAYTCTLTTGEQLFGLIASENASSITFKLADASLRPVLRTEIEALHSNDISLMPEGLEATLTSQDLADLILFLRQPN
jgi:putative membrane-bound dehydrogenase-like protein